MRGHTVLSGTIKPIKKKNSGFAMGSVFFSRAVFVGPRVLIGGGVVVYARAPQTTTRDAKGTGCAQVQPPKETPPKYFGPLKGGGSLGG